MYVIYNPNTLYRLKSKTTGNASWHNQGTAQAVLTRAIRDGRATENEFVVGTIDQFNGADAMITVKSLMTGADVQIRKSQRGSCLDPSMERYWTM